MKRPHRVPRRRGFAVFDEIFLIPQSRQISGDGSEDYTKFLMNQYTRGDENGAEDYVLFLMPQEYKMFTFGAEEKRVKRIFYLIFE